MFDLIEPQRRALSAAAAPADEEVGAEGGHFAETLPEQADRLAYRHVQRAPRHVAVDELLKHARCVCRALRRRKHGAAATRGWREVGRGDQRLLILEHEQPLHAVSPAREHLHATAVDCEHAQLI
eukprot:6115560-Prymnesium_polylepis.1